MSKGFQFQYKGIAFLIIWYWNTFRLILHSPTESVDSFTDALEHNEAQRYANYRVEHCEELATDRRRRWVPVACATKIIIIVMGILGSKAYLKLI